MRLCLYHIHPLKKKLGADGIVPKLLLSHFLSMTFAWANIISAYIDTYQLHVLENKRDVK